MDTMHAIQFDSYGTPDVLHLAVVPKPTAKPGEVLVRVNAVGINPHDLYTRAGSMRLITGRKFPLGTGIEFAGEVVGGSASTVKVGQRVWGSLPAMKPEETGAAAEYLAVPADRVAPIPANLSQVEAASMVVTATTAIRALKIIARVKPGEAVLIRGAGGGVGLAAVQVASALGAKVSTLSSTRDFDILRGLGAEATFDYATTTARDLGVFDVIFDTVGTELLSYQRLLGRRGRMITIAFTSLRAFAAIGASWIHGSRRIRAFSSDAKSDLLEAAAELVESGSLRPMVGATYPMDNIARAHTDQQAGGQTGKRVLTI